MFIRYRRKRRQQVQKPGRQDLFANTSGTTQDAMNEYTYINMSMQGTDPALCEDGAVPLQAHESALSTPLYDDNANRTLTRSLPSEQAVIANGHQQLPTVVDTMPIIHGDPDATRAQDENPLEYETSLTTNKENDDRIIFDADLHSAGDNKTSGFHGVVTGSGKTAGDAHDVTSSYAADGITDVDLYNNSCEAVDDGDSSSKSDATSAAADAANDDHSTDEAINEDQRPSQHNEPSDIVAPPATFGESSTDDTTAVTSVRDDLDASSDIQVADTGSSMRRTRTNSGDAELTLTPNPYQSFSVV